MHILVLGSSGHVGHSVVTQLLDAGHHVSAFVHGSNPFEHHPRLQVISGDVHIKGDLARSLTGVDAVISCLGSWGTPQKDILSSAMRHLVPLMEQGGVKRLISLTGSGARLPGERFGMIATLNRLLLFFVAPAIIRDAEQHLALLAHSSLDWTVIRSPVMTSGAGSNYHLSLTPPAPYATIPRYSVVAAITSQLHSEIYYSQAPHIHRQ